MSSKRKQSDARRFGFCIRCLRPDVHLEEHHQFGRKARPGSVVFVCGNCHPDVEGQQGPNLDESRILEEKTRLLVSSRSLHHVLSIRENVIQAFEVRNRNGPGATFTVAGIILQGHLGAVGVSGNRYYLVPPDTMDEFVSDPSEKTWNKDGIGGPAGDIGWVRFRGGRDNILSRFIDLHSAQGNPGGSLEGLRQD